MTDPLDPVLTVIVLNYNGVVFLPRCFQSLREQTLRNFQVLLVDNNSTDESIELTRRDFPDVDVLKFDENLGYAEANNRAADSSHTTYLCFLNNDTHLDARALEILVAAADARPETPILAPQLRSYDGVLPLSCGMGVDVLGFPATGAPHEGDVFYADGACFFIRRDVFHDLGGFDAYHFMFFEEIDLCWRAWLRGFRVGIVPQAIIFHKAGGTIGSSLVEGERHSSSRQKRWLTHRNQFATMLKNYSTPALFFILPLFATLTVGEVVLLMVTGQRSVVTQAYLRAWRDLFRSRAHILTVRRTVQASRTVDDRFILRRMQWKLAAVSQFLRTGMPTIK